MIGFCLFFKMSELRSKIDVRDLNFGRVLGTICDHVLDLVHWQTLSRLVQRYDAESKVRHFGCRQQLICMAFAQLTWREPAYQTLLRNQPQCSEVTDLDRGGRLPDGGHPSQAAPTSRQIAPSSF